MDPTAADGGSERGEPNRQENITVEEQQPEASREGGEGDRAGREARGSDGAGAGDQSQAAAEGNPPAEAPKVEDPQIKATEAAEGQTERSAKRTRQKSRKAREEDHAQGSDDDPVVRPKAGGSSGKASGTAEAKSATKKADDRGFEWHGGKLFVSVKRKQMPAGTSQTMADYFVDNKLHIDTLQVKLVCPQANGPPTQKMVTPWVEFRKNTNGTPDVRPHVPAEALSAAMEVLHNNDMWFEFGREGRDAVLTVTRREHSAADKAAGTSGTKRGPKESADEPQAKRQRADPSADQQQGTSGKKRKGGGGTPNAASTPSGKKPAGAATTPKAASTGAGNKRGAKPAASDLTPPPPPGGQTSGGRSHRATGSRKHGQPGGSWRLDATADELAAEALMGLNTGAAWGASNPGGASTSKARAQPEAQRPPIPRPFTNNDSPGARSVDRKAAVVAAREAAAAAAAKKSADAAAAKKSADAAAKKAADAAAAKKATQAAAARDAAAAATARDAAAAAAARDAAAAAAAGDPAAARARAAAAARALSNTPLRRLNVLLADLLVLEADLATWMVWGGAAYQAGHSEQLQQWITLLDDFRKAVGPRFVRQAVDAHTADIRGEHPGTWLTRTYVGSRVAEMSHVQGLGELLSQFRRGTLVLDRGVLDAVEAAVRGIARGNSSALIGAMMPLIGLEQINK